jgi:hypothetical protein
MRPLPLPEGVKLGYVDSTRISSIGIHFNKVHLIHPATIRTISIYVNSPSGKIRMGIYRSSDEKPSKLIASCKEFEPVRGWNTLEVTSQVECDPGDYWVGWLPSSGSLNVRQRTPETKVFGGYGAEVPCPYGPLPDLISSLADYTSLGPDYTTLAVQYSNVVSSIYAYFTYDHSAKKSPE